MFGILPLYPLPSSCFISHFSCWVSTSVPVKFRRKPQHRVCSAGAYTQEAGLESGFYLLWPTWALSGRELKNSGYLPCRWRWRCDQLILSCHLLGMSHKGENFKGGNSFGGSNGYHLLSTYYLPGITCIQSLILGTTWQGSCYLYLMGVLGISRETSSSVCDERENFYKELVHVIMEGKKPQHLKDGLAS